MNVGMLVGVVSMSDGFLYIFLPFVFWLFSRSNSRLKGKKETCICNSL